MWRQPERSECSASSCSLYSGRIRLAVKRFNALVVLAMPSQPVLF
jgi:hypothetical protein